MLPGRNPWRADFFYEAYIYICILFVRVVESHYCDVIMSATALQITSLTIVYSIVNSGADQRKHQRFASLAFVRGIHQWPVNSPHKGPVTRKMFPFDDVMIPQKAVDDITFVVGMIYVDGLMQDYSISSAWAMEILQYLQCLSSGDTAVLHWAIDMNYLVILDRGITITDLTSHCGHS